MNHVAPIRLIAVLCCLIALVPPRGVLASDPAQDLEYANALSRAFERAADTIEDSVVHITTAARTQRVRRDFFGRRYRVGRPRLQPTGLGSGVIIDEKGLIVTNRHVVANADKLIVRLHDGREIEASLVGADEETDLAVIRIDAPDLRAATFGDSDALRVGEWVLAVGSPFGFDYSVTSGIVSAKERSLSRDPTEASYQEFIQTDAPINPGNSGGPLINLKGEIVGINAAIISRAQQSAGLGFAIPSVVVRRVVDSLVQTGRVERGYLGVYMAELSPEQRRALRLRPDEGIEVTGIEEGGPADRAGLKEGDILLRINGREVIGGMNRVRNLISLSKPGETIALQILRDGRRIVKNAELSSRSALLGYAEIESLGLAAQSMTREISRRLGYRRHIPGLLVMRLAPGGPADRAGIEVGDILTAVDGRRFTTPDEMRDLLSSSLGVTTIEIVRGRMRGTVEVELE